jgi:ComF family protein
MRQRKPRARNLYWMPAHPALVAGGALSDLRRAFPGFAGVCACLSDPPAFDGTAAALAYRFPMDALIHAYKYRGDLTVGAALAELLFRILAAEPLPDFILPMPLHPARLRERGFNQALEIARSVSRALGVPVLADACERVRDTAPQASLPWKERGKNIRGAFACGLSLEGQRVAIVDDVMTTGHTLDEVAKVLRRRGAASIRAWAVVRALRQP